jgi:lipopolysaccharide biosynthesis regulator YciM
MVSKKMIADEIWFSDKEEYPQQSYFTAEHSMQEIRSYAKKISAAVAGFLKRYSLDELLAVAEILPGNGQLQCDLAREYLRNNDLARAEQMIKEALELLPDFGAAYVYWGDVAKKKGDPGAAMDRYKTGLKKNCQLAGDVKLRLHELRFSRESRKPAP